MSEMIQRVARALFEQDEYQGYNDETKARHWLLRQPTYERRARIVIEAMREPTEEQFDQVSATGKMWRNLTSREVYQAMIDGALKDG